MAKTFKPKILEKDVTKSIRAYLKTIGIFHWKVWQGLGSKKGISDLIAIDKGVSMFIEIKTPTGRLSPGQEEFLAEVNYHGCVGIVVRSVDDIMNALALIKRGQLQEARDKYRG